MSYQEDNLRRNTGEDEISLIDLFLTLWKRKWVVIFITALVTIGAISISLYLPEIYEVSAIIEVAKDADGKPLKNPQNLDEMITAGVFDGAIADSLDIPLEDIPKFKTTIPKSSSLIKISVESLEPERAVSIVKEILEIIAADAQLSSSSLQVEIKEKIGVLELEKNRLLQQKELIIKQLEQAEETIANLETDREKAIFNSPDKAITVLLYSNEIQNQRNYNYGLREKLVDLNAQVEETDSTLKNLNLVFKRAEDTIVVKQPSVPRKPIKPKKLLIIVVALIFGFLSSIVIAFMMEFVSRIREQQNEYLK